MMFHRKDFKNHNFSFKIHCKPIYSVCYACSGPEGIIHYSKSTEHPKIQEIAFKMLNSVGFLVCLKCPLQLFLGLMAFPNFKEYYIKAFIGEK